MTTYIYTIFIPVIILTASYFIEGKPREERHIVNFLFNVFKNYIFYSLLLYYLESEHYLNVGLSFVSVMLLAIPLGIIIIPFKLYYFFKKEK